jgi:predicted Zn-dependent protease
MTSREEFRFLADLVFKRSSGDHTLVTLQDHNGGTTRFANNQVVQNVNTRRGTFTVMVAYGQRHGEASTSDFTAGAVQGALKQAERIARVSPEDEEFLAPPLPQSYPTVNTFREETAVAGPVRRLEYAQEAIGQCRMENLQGAGIVSSSHAAVGVAATTSLFAFEERTDSRFSITVQAADATGWASAAHRSIDHLKIQERTLQAIRKAQRGGGAVEIPAGRYPVVLEPAAVAGLLTWFMWMLEAKAYEKGTSPFRGKLGEPVIDPRLSLLNRPGHPNLLGLSFGQDGLPTTDYRWIDRGTLRGLAYDRYSAKKQGIDPIPTLESPILQGEEPTGARVDDLIRTTERGLLITNFWYIRTVNPSDLTLTGMTRDGTFVIEHGQITKPVRNLRFHESPFRVFNLVDRFTAPAEAVTSETSKLLVPAMKIRELTFSSVTRF